MDNQQSIGRRIVLGPRIVFKCSIPPYSGARPVAETVPACSSGIAQAEAWNDVAEAEGHRLFELRVGA